MQSRFRWPDRAVPDLPSVELGSTAEGWRQVVVPGTVCAWVGPDDGTSVRANITVTVQRRPSSECEWDADRVAVSTALRQIPGVSFLSVDESEKDGRPRFLVRYAFGDDRLGDIRQVVLLSSVVSGDVSDLVQVTGTTAANASDHEAAFVLDAVSAARIETRPLP